MRRGAAWLLLALVAGPHRARADSGAPVSLLVSARAGASDVAWLPVRRGPYQVVAAPAGLAFVTAASERAPLVPAEPGKRYARLAVSAKAPGHYDFELSGVVVHVDAIEARALDGQGRAVTPETSHASLSRTLPDELGAVPGEDEDALSFLLIAPPGVDLAAVEVLSRREGGAPLDVLPRLRTQGGECPPGTAPELVCVRTPPIRAVADGLDRSHPALASRSIRAELGGSLRVATAGRSLLELRVGGPRHTKVGPIERFRARLRVLILRMTPGGPPALGRDDASAEALMQSELTAASALWSQCGIELYEPGKTSIQVVDPPPAQLLGVGCGLGLPASGGSVGVRVGGKAVEVTTRAGESPLQVAELLSRALGRSVSVFQNMRTADALLPTADLLLNRAARREALAGSSTDPTMPLCSGQLDLAAGLAHFSDGNAFAGTVEERALLRAFDDADPGSIEVLVVPSFVRQERIGESFFASAGSSLSNAVIIDRTAVQVGARSFALAHELGHVLLAMPGHPDDFGVDQSWALMDSDVSDATIFGPRRLSLADCERAVIQSGPTAPVPLLTPVPLR